MMDENIKVLISRMKLNPPATKEALKEIEIQLEIKFPGQYFNFMLESNGAVGCIGAQSYLMIWSADHLVEYNEGYMAKEFAPGLVYFATDGGAMVYAFDKRKEGAPIIEYSFESVHVEDAKPLSNTFVEFLQYLYNRTW